MKTSELLPKHFVCLLNITNENISTVNVIPILGIIANIISNISRFIHKSGQKLGLFLFWVNWCTECVWGFGTLFSLERICVSS